MDLNEKNLVFEGSIESDRYYIYIPKEIDKIYKKLSFVIYKNDNKDEFIDRVKAVDLSLFSVSLIYHPEARLYGCIEADQLIDSKNIYSVNLQMDSLRSPPNRDILFYKFDHMNAHIRDFDRLTLKLLMKKDDENNKNYYIRIYLLD